MADATVTVYSFTTPHGGDAKGVTHKATAEAISTMGARALLHTAQVVPEDQVDDAGFWSNSLWGGLDETSRVSSLSILRS
jgi:hypothetical protein